MFILAFPTNVALGYHFPITISNPLPSLDDSFGWAVSIDGNKILVGSTLGDDGGVVDAGNAYIFDATTGTLLRTFNNPTPILNDVFGYSVSLSGNNALIGAFGDDTGAENAGSAYLFDATTGTLLRTFNNPTPVQNDSMGFSVSYSGNKVLLSAPLDDTGFQNAGTAYLFDATTGALLYTLNNPAPASNDYFGYSVSISGNSVLIGAFQDDAGATDAGTAYLFDATTGTLLRTFNNPAPASGDQFGRSVSLSGNNVVVSANGDDAGATDAGTAYLFDATTGALLYTLNNPTPVLGDSFGESISISGSSIIIGAYQDDTGASNAGSAYLFNGVFETSSVAQGQTQVLGTCGISFPNGNSVNYGSLVPNTVSSQVKLNMTNSGSVNAILTVSGTNWLDAGLNNVMLVNRTHYNITSSTYFQKTSLQTFDQTLTNSFLPAIILQTFWQLQTILLNPSFTGSTTQTMNFAVIC